MGSRQKQQRNQKEIMTRANSVFRRMNFRTNSRFSVSGFSRLVRVRKPKGISGLPGLTSPINPKNTFRTFRTSRTKKPHRTILACSYSMPTTYQLPALRGLGELAGTKPVILIDSREQLLIFFPSGFMPFSSGPFERPGRKETRPRAILERCFS